MNIHVIEDEPGFNRLLVESLKQFRESSVLTFTNGHDYIAYLQGLASPFDLPAVITLDLMLPDIDGIELLKRIYQCVPSVDVVIISGQDDIDTAYQLFQLGIYDYITKNSKTMERLVFSMRKLLEKWQMNQQLRLLQREVSGRYAFNSSLIGESGMMRNVFMLVEKAIQHPNYFVSIQGESGTGKGMIAKTIHYNSSRHAHPFISINVDAVSTAFQEVEFYGCEKEAHAFVSGMKRGCFELVGDGTLFIEEVGALDAGMQQKLLKVLQNRSFLRVGGLAEFPMRARIITSSSVNLEDEVAAGRFNKELYFCLKGLPIILPRLRERQTDILLMAGLFIEQFSVDNGVALKSLSAKAKQKLMGYDYPGNIPELRSIIELGAILSTGDLIDEEHIIFNSSYYEPEGDSLLSSEMTLKQYDEVIIHHFLTKYDNNVLKVAEKLDIGKSTIYNLLKKEK